MNMNWYNNDPRLFEKIKVKVIRPFRVDGKVVAVGEIVSIERNLAESLEGIKLKIL